jgi:hypothetical protein
VTYMASIGLDAWLAIRRALSSRTAARRAVATLWRTLPGDVLGWTIMRGCGVATAGRHVRCGDVDVAVVERPEVARWFRANLMPVVAQTVGRYVFATGPIPDETLAHELEHVRQWSRLGPLYLPAYFGSSAAAFVRGRRAYWDNRFETAARKRAADEMAARAAEDRAPTREA